MDSAYTATRTAELSGCDERVRKCGFVCIEEWPSCYFQLVQQLLLVMHVDDLKMSGPAGA